MKRLIVAMIFVFALAPLAGAADKNTATKPKEKKMTEQTTQTLKAKDALHPLVEVKTSLGDFVLELDADKAPISTINFIQYAKDDYYKGLIFHRIDPKFMIQGGGYFPDNREKRGQRPPIKNEWNNGLKNVRGTIAMARTNAPDSATAQFFINVVDNGFLSEPRGGAGYAVFGKVVKGMDIVDKIRNAPTTFSPIMGDNTMPATPIVINEVKLISEFDQAAAEKKIKK